MLYFPLIIPKIAFLMLIYTDERTAFSGVFVANIGCTDVLLFPWLLAGFLALWLTVGGEISGLCWLDLLRRDRSWILVAWRGWSRREMNIDYLAY